jgi:hypothetical protein
MKQKVATPGGLANSSPPSKVLESEKKLVICLHKWRKREVTAPVLAKEEPTAVSRISAQANLYLVSIRFIDLGLSIRENTTQAGLKNTKRKVDKFSMRWY